MATRGCPEKTCTATSPPPPAFSPSLQRSSHAPHSRARRHCHYHSSRGTAGWVLLTTSAALPRPRHPLLVLASPLKLTLHLGAAKPAQHCCYRCCANSTTCPGCWAYRYWTHAWLSETHMRWSWPADPVFYTQAGRPCQATAATTPAHPGHRHSAAAPHTAASLLLCKAHCCACKSSHTTPALSTPAQDVLGWHSSGNDVAAPCGSG